MYCFVLRIVLFYVLFVLCRSVYCVCVQTCAVLLPPSGYPIAIDKCIISYIISHIVSYHIKRNAGLDL